MQLTQSSSTNKNKIVERLLAQEELLRRLQSEKIAKFPWNTLQWKAMNATEKRVNICGANQYSGKTTCNTARQSIHMTHKYPAGWYGRRYEGNIKVGCCSKNLDKLRDTVVEKIFGTRDQLGTGWVPKDLMVESSIIWSKKAKNLIQYAEVKRINDEGEKIGICQFYSFSFDQGWEAVTGYTLHDVLISEEPSIEFHDEMKSRTNKCKGQIVIDMVPMLGDTPLYRSYAEDTTGTRKLFTITIDDCEHLTAEEIEEAKLEERDSPWIETRLYGRPTRGEGLIFTSHERNVMMAKHLEHFPGFYKVIIGIDIPHTTGAFAAVKIVHDPEKDRIFVTEAMKFWDSPREVQAHRLLDMGGRRIPIAWPHDAGRNEGEEGAAGPIVTKLRHLGCNMLYDPAYMVGWDGKKTNRTMDWVTDVRDRERSNLIKYSPHVGELVDERRKYAHKKGRVVANQDDHCLDAMGKGIFMLRHARRISQVIDHPYRTREKENAVRRRDVDFFSL